MNLDKLFTAKTIGAYWSEVSSNQVPFLGTAFFPSKKKAGLDLKWIKGNKGLPVSLMPSNFDAKATFRDRIGVKAVQTEMPFFREGFLLKEKDRQEILRAQDSNDAYVQDVLNHIFDDASQLVVGADVVAERMRMQLLAPVDGTPKINITANNVAYEYNYDPSGEYKANHFLEMTTETDKWTDFKNSDPIGDLQDAQESVENLTGTKPTLALMNSVTFKYLMKNETVKSAVLAQNLTATVIMTEALVKNVIKTLLNLDIVVYSKKVKTEDGTEIKLYPDNMVTLLPGTPLGSTWYGTTPEEADLLSGGEAVVEIVNTGVALTTIKIPHPVNIETICSEIVLPSYEAMDSTFVMKVA